MFDVLILHTKHNTIDLERYDMNRINYVEYDAVHNKDFVFDIQEGHDCWLLLLTHTPAIFLVKDELRKYPANCAVLYKPYQKIYYRACEESYENDWIRFETDETFVMNSPIVSGEPFLVNDSDYCHKIYQLLVSENILSNHYKEISIDHLLRILFNKLLESYNYRQVSPLYKNLIELKKEVYRNPNLDWTVSKMAMSLNISGGYLEELYKNAFGTSCMDDVINSRITLAKKHLVYDQYTIAEIASLCGYHNIEHFYRQFKKITGSTPGKYRKTPNQIFVLEGDA